MFALITQEPQAQKGPHRKDCAALFPLHVGNSHRAAPIPSRRLDQCFGFICARATQSPESQ
jgi:hypothetical protein